MHLIIGGAYQGKTDYAKAQYSLADEDIYTCCTAEIPQDVKALRHLERFARSCAAQGRSAVAVWKELGISPEVVICDDVFCGIVPMDPEERLWREETGRLLTAIAADAARVTRIFCGLPMELKP